MDDSLLSSLITAFVMLIVVINPVTVASVFVSVTRGGKPPTARGPEPGGGGALLRRALFPRRRALALTERRVIEKLGDALPRGTARFFPGVGHMGPISHAAVVHEAIVAHLGAV